MISIDLMKSSEVRKAGDRSNSLCHMDDLYQKSKMGHFVKKSIFAYLGILNRVWINVHILDSISYILLIGGSVCYTIWAQRQCCNFNQKN